MYQKEMRGVGGPLLCISDLLADIGQDHSAVHAPSSTAALPNLPPSHLPNLFQESFGELNAALDGTDHSWTPHTLKLCSVLETANKLVDSTGSQVALLSEKVEELQRIVYRRDTAVKAAKQIQSSLLKP